MKVVLDTNIVISAVFFGGNPRTIIDKVLDDEILCFASQDILDEYHEVFTRMLKGKTNSFSSMVFRLFNTKLVTAQVASNIVICRDPDDDKFINCACDTGAEYIISGDNDLLSIKEYKGIPIVSALEFLMLLERNLYLDDCAASKRELKLEFKK